MHFASLPPWWLTVLAALAVAAAVFAAYRRPLAPLSTAQRAVLIGLRSAALIALLLVLFRPVALLPPAGDREQVVPVLVDVSRSMRVADADGDTRIARAAALLRFDLLPLLSRQFHTELLSVGDAVETASIDALTARASQSDLSGALARCANASAASGSRASCCCPTAATPRRPRRPDATSAPPRPGPCSRSASGPPAGCAIAKSSASRPAISGSRTRRSTCRCRRSAAGSGATPFQLRVLAGGKLLESRRVVPSADGSPIEQRFTVFPDPRQPTVYTVEIPAADGEPVTENNTRSVLVSPAGRKRRLLVIEGAPGFEHTLRQAGVGGRPWARGRCGRSKRQERQRQRHVPDSGGRRPCHHADRRLPGEARGSLRLRRRHRLERRGRLLHARPVDDDRGLRVRARRRPARDRRPIVRAARAGRHAGRSGAAGGARRAPRRDCVARSLATRAPANGSSSRRRARRIRSCGSARPAKRRAGSGPRCRRWPRPRRSAMPGPAPSCSPSRRPPGGAVFPVVAVQRVRPRALDGVRRRGVVALADDGRLDRSEPRVVLAAGGAMAGGSLARSGGHRGSRRPQPGDSVAIDVDARDASFAPVADAASPPRWSCRAASGNH